MTLRAKVLVAQLPLGLALAIVGALSLWTVGTLGKSSQRILRENYRSVLAAQRMDEAIDVLNTTMVADLAGAAVDVGAVRAAQQREFEAELRVEESLFTEVGEPETAAHLRAAWTAYLAACDGIDAASGEDRRRRYFDAVEPAFREVKRGTAAILALNQDAMVRKSDEASGTAGRMSRVMTGVTFVALLIGFFVTSALTARLLQPLGSLTEAVRRIGEGDLAARARVTGRDEIGELATDFNAMAERLRQYRTSSLGELLQAQQAAQAAIDSIPDPVVVLDVQGRVVSTNEAGEALFPLGDAAGDALTHADPAMRAMFDRVREHVLAGHGPYVPRGFEEAVGLDALEGPRWLLPRASPLYGESAAVTGVTVVLQDVTRLRRFDELRNDLVATVAHEFRTPLTSLHMSIHLCVEGAAGPLTERQADLLHAAREDCERLQGIVDDLLDLARLQGGQAGLRVRPTSAAAIVHEAVEAHAGAARDRHVRLAVDLPSELPDVAVDPDRVRLVFANLITNALRHTPADGVVTVLAHADGSTVRFEVRDEGPGIAEEHRARIFERFYRVPGSPSGGAGLGLSIAKEIVEAHGGAVGVTSAPGGGSTFWFTVPVAA